MAFLALATILPLNYIDQDETGGRTARPAPPTKAGGVIRGTRVGDLLPVPRDGVRAFVGRPAFGLDVLVQSINGDVGFWIGTSERNRLYVEWGAQVGRNERRGFQPRQGERVDLTGPVQRAPRDPATTLRLNPPEARQVRTQGGFINASNVARARHRQGR